MKCTKCQHDNPDSAKLRNMEVKSLSPTSWVIKKGPHFDLCMESCWNIKGVFPVDGGKLTSWYS